MADEKPKAVIALVSAPEGTDYEKIVKEAIKCQETPPTLNEKFVPSNDAERIIREVGQRNAKAFEEGVDILRRSEMTPNAEINRLMQDVWCLVGNRITPLGMIPHCPVPTLSFLVMGKKDGPLQAIIVPPFLVEKRVIDWARWYREKTIQQLGAIVSVGSQARDFHNGKFAPETAMDCEIRANAYEAEFYNMIIDLGIDGAKFDDDPYVVDLLKRFPNGLASLDPALKYEPKPAPPEAHGPMN